MKHKTWRQKLNKTEMKHFLFATNGERTLTAFKASRADQKKLQPTREICFDCLRIARKLGLEE